LRLDGHVEIMGYDKLVKSTHAQKVEGQSEREQQQKIEWVRDC